MMALGEAVLVEIRENLVFENRIKFFEKKSLTVLIYQYFPIVPTLHKRMPLVLGSWVKPSGAMMALVEAALVEMPLVKTAYLKTALKFMKKNPLPS
jgi:hypothetical protein